MYSRYHHLGLELLAFPCNQFGKQEPGTDEQIKQFAAVHHYPGYLMHKIDVNGKDAIPVWTYLKEKGGGGAVKWNFEKFLVGRDGVPYKRYGSPFDMKEIAADVDALVARPSRGGGGGGAAAVSVAKL